MDIVEKSFLNQENVCIALGIPKDPIAKQDLKDLCLEAAEDGISFIALDKTEHAEGRVVGFVINKLQVNEPGPSFFEKHAARCRSRNAKELIQIMIDIDDKCQLFENSQVDCIGEIMFMGILPEYTNNKLGTYLGIASVECLLFLKLGVNLKLDLDGNPMPIQPVPRGVCCIYSSKYIKNIWKNVPDDNISFIAIEIPYKAFHRNGKLFSDFINTTIHEKLGVVYLNFDLITEEVFDAHFRSKGLAKRQFVEMARKHGFGEFYE
ncbi:hypothetical protein HHI36_004210 [Cryptolaemus montrouzieri]|uniref:N-acetyltransferase domain-containing protein n=1 Tax=Cryptolaemus montrouzieri TaxID=559131 RepID=A0ABD2NS42_9CUCU